MNVQIDVFEPKLFQSQVADEILASMNDAIADRGVCRLALAGGGTPSAIYRLLSQPPRVSDIDWPKVQLFWGDERWVPRSDPQSNYKMVSDAMLSHLPAAGPKIYGVDTSLASPEQGALAYAQTIRQVFGLTGNEQPVFDIVLLGVGEDGHTASLFPHTDAISKRGSIAAVVPHPDGGKRITLLADTLFSARDVLFIVKGEDKAGTLERVMHGNEPVELLPSKLYKTATGRVRWLLDSLAASRVQPSPRH